jgi:hypothetical protein
MKKLLFFVTLLISGLIQSCPTCYVTRNEYTPPFFADENQDAPQPQRVMTQRPVYTQTVGRRGAPVMPRTGKRNSIGRTLKPNAQEQNNEQNLDTNPTFQQ